MRTLATLAILLVGLPFVFGAPAAKAHCPHNGDDTHAHCGDGEPPAPAPLNEFRFIGFTGDATNALPDTIDSGQGMLAMHALCQDDFGENARMCTSEEFWLSPNAAAAANSWLLKHCTSWATASSTIWGLVVKPDGKPSKGMGEDCDIARPVTCCAPIQ